MSNQVNDVFNAFVEAQKAMQRLPEAEAELNRANGEKEVIRSRFEAECARNEDLRQIVQHQDTERAEMEAKLADATFRESELRAKLEMLTGLLKTVVGEANSAIDMVEPKPEPVVEPVSNEATTAPNDAGQPIVGSTSDENASASNDAVSVSSNPTQGDSTTGTTIPSADTDSIDLPGKFPWEAPKVSDAEDTGMYGGSYTEATVTPQENHTEVQPTQDLPYWAKPSNTTWFDWRAAGNRIAPWCEHASDETLKSIFN